MTAADMSSRSDVLIVGAGPSGSFLAYLLARRGFGVTIIDKASFPRDKVCGGGLSNKTIELLPFDLSPVVQRRVTGAFLTYQNRDTVVKDLGERGGVTVLRSELDDFLLRKATTAGARFHESTPFVSSESAGDGVAVTTGRGVFMTRYLVGADGVFSSVRQSVFGPHLVTYMPAVEALVSVAPHEAERFGTRVLFDFGGMPRGYGWIFPKKDHLNVGVFSIYATRSIKRELTRFMSRYAVLGSAGDVRHFGFSIPLENCRREFERDHVLLLGDAAGLADSFYGEGIYFALKSSVLAAEALQSAFDHPRDRAYSGLIAAGIQRDLTYAGMNARMFFAMQKLAFSLMVRSKQVNDNYAEVIAGGVGYAECFYKTVLTSPYWLFSRRLAPHSDEGF
jgi:geranylgeranyl reductase family protein